MVKGGEAYSSGKTQKEIGEDFGVSQNYVFRTLKSLEACGYFYFKPEKEIKKKTKKLIYEAECNERDAEIFYLKQNWTGTDTEFLDYVEKKYNLKRNNIWNIVATQHKINALKGVKASDKYTFRDGRMNTRNIYLNFYKKLRPDLKITYDIIPESNTQNIPIGHLVQLRGCYSVYQMFVRNFKRLSFEDTIKRDKAICVEYLNWQGTSIAFYEYVTKKYFITEIYAKEIICNYFKANPEQYINKLEY